MLSIAAVKVVAGIDAEDRAGPARLRRDRLQHRLVLHHGPAVDEDVADRSRDRNVHFSPFPRGWRIVLQLLHPGDERSERYGAGHIEVVDLGNLHTEEQVADCSADDPGPMSRRRLLALDRAEDVGPLFVVDKLTHPFPGVITQLKRGHAISIASTLRTRPM